MSLDIVLQQISELFHQFKYKQLQQEKEIVADVRPTTVSVFFYYKGFFFAGGSEEMALIQRNGANPKG